MKKSKFALVALIVIDVLLILGGIYLVGLVNGGTMDAADKAEAISRITTVFGGVIGAVTVVFGIIHFSQKRKGL